MLIDMEKTVEVCDQGIPKEISRRERLCLLGLVVSEKSVNKEAYKSSMQSLWPLKEKVLDNLRPQWQRDAFQ